jgi:hypothetical protein
MKRKSLLIITVLVMVGILAASTILLYRHSQASSAPLGSTLDIWGSNLTVEGPIQIPSGSVTIVFDYTPLNSNASITMMSADHSIIDFRKVNTGVAGELTMNESYGGAFYVQTYGATWHLVAH